MGGPNKLLATFGGIALVRKVVDAAIRSRADPVIVVTGARAGEIVAALDGISAKLVHNPDHAGGLSTSIAAGLEGLDEHPGAPVAALFVLADMPDITADILNRLIDAFDPAAGKTIVVPTANGRRGNPVLWGRTHFEALRNLKGDGGARHLIGRHADAISRVEIGAAAMRDIDTPAGLVSAGGELPGGNTG